MARKVNARTQRITPRQLENPFAESEQTRNGMRPEARKLLILGIVAIVLVLAALVLPVYLFQHSMTELTLSVFINRLTSNMDALFQMITGNFGAYESRFMLVLVCAISGAALGLCGATYQGAFNNPLAAPKTLGVMGGGALGALIYVVFLRNIGGAQLYFSSSYTVEQKAGLLSTLSPYDNFWIQYGECICSMAGCFAVVGIVIAITAVLGRGRMSNVIVIIFGTVFPGVVTAIISFARYYFTTNADIDTADELREIENYTMIRDYTFQDLLIVILPIVVCMVIVLAMRGRFALLSFGDDEARSMGINVNRTRYGMIAICTVMVAISISFCGHVAFLGFISGQLARRIVGPDFRYLLPASCFVGGGFLTVIQYICQSGLPWTDPNAAGVVCSVLGACLFMGIVLVQRGKAVSGDWR